MSDNQRIVRYDIWDCQKRLLRPSFATNERVINGLLQPQMPLLTKPLFISRGKKALKSLFLPLFSF